MSGKARARACADAHPVDVPDFGHHRPARHEDLVKGARPYLWERFPAQSEGVGFEAAGNVDSGGGAYPGGRVHRRDINADLAFALGQRYRLRTRLCAQLVRTSVTYPAPTSGPEFSTTFLVCPSAAILLTS